MSEKLKPNFTAVPNVLFDEVMRTLAPGAVKLVFAICRYTYGWGKQSDRISLSQLQAMTGMSRWSVVRSLKQLSGLLSVTPGSANQASEYRLNVEISDADVGTICDQSQKVPSHLGSHPRVTIQRKSKERRNTAAKAADSFQLEAFGEFYEIYPRRVARASALKSWVKINPDADLTQAIMQGAARYAAAMQDKEPDYIAHPATWLNGRRWEDEPASRRGTLTLLKRESQDALY